MSLVLAIRIIKSLSGSEKRFVTLHARKQQGEKRYFDLFTLISDSGNSDNEKIRARFQKTHPRTSIHNAARYLVGMITDCLISLRVEKDPYFGMLQDLMRVRVLQERSLPDDAYELLQKIKEQAAHQQQHLIEYITCRDELNYFSLSGFANISDKTLVGKQMKAKDILKSIGHIQDHHSLFELLKYRLVHSGKIASQDDQKKLNDLMLSEMTLVAGKSKDIFAAQKLHLLFQSYFFIDIGDYQSALKVFAALNKLFEKNRLLLEHPPLDYFSALSGILDSLHALGKFDQIDFYTDQLKTLDQAAYPEHFRFQVRKTIAVYDLAVLNATGEYKKAIHYCEQVEYLLKSFAVANEERQWELYFYFSLTYYHAGDRKKAHRYLGELVRTFKLVPHHPICKAIRLLDILMHYEKGDVEYLQYEIRSYKRFFKQPSLLASEKLLLKMIQAWPDPRRKRIPLALQKKLLSDAEAIEENRYERQLLKYFDFGMWIRKRIGG